MNTHAHFKQVALQQTCEVCGQPVSIKWSVSFWNGYRNVFVHVPCHERKEYKHEPDEE